MHGMLSHYRPMDQCVARVSEPTPKRLLLLVTIWHKWPPKAKAEAENVLHTPRNPGNLLAVKAVQSVVWALLAMRRTVWT